MPLSSPPEDSATSRVRRSVPAVHAATLLCENCGKETPHRILRLAPMSARRPGHLSGTARCRTCGFTHRFESVAAPLVEIAEVLSAGPRSEHRRILVASRDRIELGKKVPGSDEQVLVQRIETRGGQSVSSARPEEVATIWAVRDLGAIVPVSVVEGARTWTERLTLPRGSRLAVGEPLSVRGHRLRIVALRARGRTWRLPDDAFVASEVQRVYARRTESPPAGRSPWRRGRGSSNSRERATSTSGRSRSGPGARTTRRLPRDRNADEGATIHRLSP